MGIQELRAAVRAGQVFKYVFFWGHQPAPDGRLSASCFSQWFDSPFGLDGVTYRTAEHYMMAEKARLFGDVTTLEAILAAATPAEAKQLGRQVTPWDQGVWEARRFAIVVRGSVAKFSSTPSLRAFLLGTKDRVLVEASPTDRIWGVGLGKDHPDATNPLAWPGLNLLGFALMEARTELRRTAGEEPARATSKR